MARLPSVSGQQAVAAFQRIGFEIRRQRGSHIILVRTGTPVTLSVPEHRELKRGTLRALIRQANLTVDEFVKLLK